jgi:hypothetical protein
LMTWLLGVQTMKESKKHAVDWVELLEYMKSLGPGHVGVKNTRWSILGACNSRHHTRQTTWDANTLTRYSMTNASQCAYL